MNHNLTVLKGIEIHAPAAKVWDVLTNPDKIKVYLFGTETITDWKVGSPIVFQGEYEGQKYLDKGLVFENKKNELLKYSYWSSFSGLEDKPENYFLVSYIIENIGENKVKFTWFQEGFASEKGQKHTDATLGDMLEQIKKIAETD